MQDSLDELTFRVIGAAITVHRSLGPGLLESAYQECLAWQLRHEGIPIRREVAIPLRYGGLHIESAYRMDLLVEDRLLVEIKAVSELAAIHEAQILSYLRLTNLSLGLLINFHVPLLRNGIRRFIHTPMTSA